MPVIKVLEIEGGYVWADIPYYSMVKVINGCNGALGANGKVGILIPKYEDILKKDKVYSSGIINQSTYDILIIKDHNPGAKLSIWRVGKDSGFSLVNKETRKEIYYIDQNSIYSSYIGKPEFYYMYHSYLLDSKNNEDDINKKEDVVEAEPINNSNVSPASILNKISYNIKQLNDMGYIVDAKFGNMYINNLNLSNLFLRKKK